MHAEFAPTIVTTASIRPSWRIRGRVKSERVECKKNESIQDRAIVKCRTRMALLCVFYHLALQRLHASSADAGFRIRAMPKRLGITTGTLRTAGNSYIVVAIHCDMTTRSGINHITANALRRLAFALDGIIF